MTRWLSDTEQEAWRGLLAMTGQIRSRLNRQLQSDSGLSLSDYEVLVLLSETTGGRLRVACLARQLDWEQSRLSHHLARMTRRDLVRREGCESDRRGAFVVLSEAGRRAIERAAPAHVDSVRQLLLSTLTDDEVRALADITRRVLGGLDATGPPCGDHAGGVTEG